jgi:hypothetical protein
MSERNWRTHAVPLGMIIGLGAGFVVAILFGTDSGITTASGYAIGAVVGSYFHPANRLWIKVAAPLLLIAVLAYAWLD